ncbi:CIH_HP2_G0007340.mRNA.1.CDS.1 [Saccharomyces cerevisiae]|nr:CIH_HP2_G0007340.mRNA.1.CDS.1 [Saccharomyces cerevisiae]CAI6415817.1 CIH_HP2_G0007340.mRNA.1.CDS.1 [Saccharomyces cerevisiae]CAI6416691.1 CIH_HP1_G0007400.mRNA.1.CDS.1 [Saccharomyces cerevisiae]CAI7184906.1 CIH_collapsed_G0007690.mRNA.1.CDS.1 [Saccharomyces cerevisiae]
MCCYCVCCTVSDFILYIVAFFFPPAAVLLRSGPCSSDFLLNVLLTLLGFLPGMLHAFYYITITSPLRNAEYVYYYQQGWVDSERNVPSNRPQNSQTPQNRPQQGSSAGNVYPSVETPLLLGAAPHDNKQSLVESPPPYVP